MKLKIMHPQQEIQIDQNKFNSETAKRAQQGDSSLVPTPAAVSIYKSAASRREVERQRRRRRENRRFAQILKVFIYHEKTGKWLHHSQLAWHHPVERKCHGECVSQCYRDSRARLLMEICRCEVVSIDEHRRFHAENGFGATRCVEFNTPVDPARTHEN